MPHRISQAKSWFELRWSQARLRMEEGREREREREREINTRASKQATTRQLEPHLLAT